MKTRWLPCFLIVAACSVPADAQTFAVGVGAGLTKPEDIQESPWFTGNVRLYPRPWLALEPEVGYWRNTDTEQGCIPDLDVCFDAEARVRDITAGVNVLVMRPSGMFQPWGGGGVGAHFLETDVTFPEFVQGGSTTRTELGIHFLAGIDINATDRIAWFVSGRYDTILDTDINQFKAYGGIRLKF